MVGKGVMAAPGAPASLSATNPSWQPQSRIASEATPALQTVQHRAFDFFWNESDPTTGLTRDRARNIGDRSATNTVASTAATGYALSALAIGVSHRWVTPQQGYGRALTTLRFLRDKLPNEHGFYFHFIDIKTGARVWDSELSSIDTSLLLLGVRVVGSYWRGTDVQRLADEITERVDWPWMQTDGGLKSQEKAPSMGWKPESGFLPYRWQGYSEAFFLYCIALGSKSHPIAPQAWNDWQIAAETLEGYHPVFGGAQPLFMAQMASGYFDVRGLRDRQGHDWWAAWRNAHLADQAYCARNPEGRKTYGEGFWGINADDLPPPAGYGANRPANGENDGTVAPTAMLAAVVFTPDASNAARHALWQKHGPQLWGRYGFSNAFNVDKNWYDVDVIGIDLGMMMLAIENARTGLVWRLLRTDPVATRGLTAAGCRLPASPKEPASNLINFEAVAIRQSGEGRGR